MKGELLYLLLTNENRYPDYEKQISKGIIGSNPISCMEIKDERAVIDFCVTKKSKNAHVAEWIGVPLLTEIMWVRLLPCVHLKYQ